MLGLNNISITGGQVISYAIGAGFSHVPMGWRYMVGLGGVPSIILACLFPFCPESPRQLVHHRRDEEAASVFHRIFKNATPQQVQDKILLIRASIEEDAQYTQGKSRFQIIKELHTVPRNFRALVVACGFMVISQMSGFNTLMYYSSTLFALVGFKNPTAVGLVVAGTNLVMTFANSMLVDPWGRRKTVVTTAWGMSASLFAVAIAFHWIPVDSKSLAPLQDTVSPAAIVVLAFIILFIVSYGVSVGNTAWMSTDFFAQEVRGMGTMYLTCSCWASNGSYSQLFNSPPAIN
jgi:SP family myo-inositol transporter-like MFS transporter 13